MSMIKALNEIYDKVDKAEFMACGVSDDYCDECVYDSSEGCFFDGIKKNLEKVIIEEAGRSKEA